MLRLRARGARACATQLAAASVSRTDPRLLRRQSTSARPAWGLISDIHFQDKGLDRINDTVSWAISEFQRRDVKTVICLGDVLNTRDSVSVGPLSAAMSFFDRLTQSFESVHVLLGNHDMHLKHSRRVSSLDALALTPLRSRICLYRELADVEIAGTPCLMMPYHEDQAAIVAHIKQLQSRDPQRLARTVGFGHLALNGAMHSKRQRDRHEGPVGPADFAPLRRTFTGHFHHHHTMAQPGGSAAIRAGEPQPGAVTYVGSPQQFNFGDLDDERRGVVIYYPHEDRFEHAVNPHAVAFTSVPLDDALKGKVKAEQVRNRFVMITDLDKLATGGLRSSKAAALFGQARERLLELGALNVRDSQLPQAGLRASEAEAATAAAAAQPADVKRVDEPETPTELVAVADLVPKFLDTFVVDLGQIYGKAKAGQQADAAEVAAWKAKLHEAGSAFIRQVDQTLGTFDTGAVFQADLAHITMQNFLGVQGRLELPLKRMPDGVWFIQGHNGAGKSTLLEAVAWCQFNKFLRSEMKADYAVNDAVGQDCMVRLDFANGVSIERFRNYSSKGGNGVKVFQNGVYKEFMDKGDGSRGSQDAIEEMLGIDFDTFARTVVLGSDTTQNFISSTAAQRRDIIEELLGLGRFEAYLAAVREANKVNARQLVEVQAKLNANSSSQNQIATRAREAESQVKAAKDRLEQSEALLRKAQQEAKDATAKMAESDAVYESKLAAVKAEHGEVVAQADDAKRAQRFHALQRQRKQRTDQLSVTQKQNEVAAERLEWQLSNAAKNREVKPMDEAVKRTVAQQATVNALLRSLVTPLPAAALAGAAFDCPTCDQNVPEAKAPAVADKLGKRNQEIEKNQKSLQTEIATLQSLLSEVDKQKTAQQGLQVQETKDRARLTELKGWLSRAPALLAAEQQQHEQRLAKAATELAATPKQMEEAAKRFDDAASHRLFTRLSQLSAQLTSLTANPPSKAARQQEEQLRMRQLQLSEKVKALERERTLHAEALAKETLQVQGFSQEQAALKLQEAKLKEVQYIHDFWDNAFGKKKNSMRSFVLENCISELNHELDHVLKFLCDDGIKSHELTSQFDSNLKLSEGYGKRSGGQRRRTDLAMFFALLQMSQRRSRYRAQFIFMDEIFDSLDRPGQDAVVKWIHNLPARLKKVFVISHASAGPQSSHNIEVSMTPHGTSMTDLEGGKPMGLITAAAAPAAAPAVAAPAAKASSGRAGSAAGGKRKRISKA